MTGHDLELSESVPDLVVDRGGPPPAPPPTPPKSPSQPVVLPRWWMPAIYSFLLGPAAVAFIIRIVTSRGPWSPVWQLWIVAFGALMAALWFVDRSEKLKAAHPNAGLHEIDTEGWQISIGTALFVIAEFVAVASFELWAGAVLIGLLLAWILLGSLPAMRRIEVRSSVQVACSPEAAFALVTDPQKWRLWVPEIEYVEPSDVPIRLGSVVRSRSRSQGQLIEQEERVTVFDPPRRCGSETLDMRGVSDMYEFGESGGGTLVTHTLHFLEPLNSAVFGGALLIRRKVLKHRRDALQRIKQLLEVGSARSV